MFTKINVFAEIRVIVRDFPDFVIFEAALTKRWLRKSAF